MGMKKDTLLLNSGRKPEDHHGIVNPPVYHASTIIRASVEAYEKAENTPFDGVYYGLHGTPTTFAFEEAVASLEDGYRAVATCSGLAAIAGALLAFLKAGDRLLMVDAAYSPTRRLCDGLLAGFGIETTYYDPLIGDGIADLLRKETAAVFVESPGSLTFEVQDVAAIAKAAHDAGATVIMDNTWSAGLYFAPFDHGVDVSIQAATKYIGGHSDLILGAITATEETFARVKRTCVSLGYHAAPDDCYLGLRGLRTLSTRLARHQETGLHLARWLARRPEVDRILHPALPGCPGHEVWKRDFTGACGLFGLVLKDYSSEAVAAMLDGMKVLAIGESWGGYESLILPTKPARNRTAVPWSATAPTLRIHAGLEDPEDLIDDLEKGLARLNGAA